MCLLAPCGACSPRLTASRITPLPIPFSTLFVCVPLSPHQLMLKDLRLAMQLASATSSPAPMAQNVAQLYRTVGAFRGTRLIAWRRLRGVHWGLSCAVNLPSSGPPALRALAGPPAGVLLRHASCCATAPRRRLAPWPRWWMQPRRAARWTSAAFTSSYTRPRRPLSWHQTEWARRHTAGCCGWLAVFAACGLGGCATLPCVRRPFS